MVRKQDLVGIMEITALLSVAFTAAYGALKVSGLVGVPAESMIRALHDRSPQIALVVLLCAALARLLVLDRSGLRSAALPLWLGVLLMASGLVISSAVRFEGHILLTEGQQFNGADEEYVEGSRALGSHARAPRFVIAAREVAPRLSKSGRDAERISLVAAYQHAGGAPREMTLGSRLPAVADGIFLRVVRFGYSPLFRITGASGEVLEESFFSLAVFPPGAEDSIRLMHTPHTYAVRYFPQGIEAAPGSREGTQSPGEPVFRLRVTRNLGILYNGTVRLHEQVLIESTAVSFEQVRKWAEIAVVKDHGVILFGAGALLFAAALVAGRIRKPGDPAGPQGDREGASR